ncbi:MAG TPA: type II CAAX endopeptidase family protein [Bryobacteraceae bacterium]|nr:type II CAAX endopeptidase family protein [Bryobacteraceae bacterium]
MLLYFLIACIPPWIGWSLLVFGVIPQNSPLTGPMFLTGESASLAGLVAAFVAQGGKGVSRLLMQAIHVKAPVQWWLYALLVPLIWYVSAGVVYLLLQARPIVFEPSALLALGTPALLVPFLFGPLGEEFGWRGFLLPRFVERFSVLPACFLVGVIWSVWHWPLFYKGIIQSPAQEIFFLIANVTGLSFLIGTVYLRTRSLLLAMLMHWSSNAAQTLIRRLLPNLPDNARDTTAFKWCVLGVLALSVMSTIPVLLRIDHRDRFSFRSGK